MRPRRSLAADLSRRHMAPRGLDGLSNGALVLMYHRVQQLASDPFSLAVSPSHFEEHLQVLRRFYRLVPLRELIADLQSGRVRPGSVAVTFDDGYADVAQHAEPLAARYAVPATVFVVTGYVGARYEVMWDDLERLLLQPVLLPQRLELTIGGHDLEWDLEDWREYSPATQVQHLGWRFAQDEAPTPRHALFRKLYYALKYRPDGERRAILDKLVQWAGLGTQGRQSHRVMTQDEILQLARGGLFDVGAHSVTHPTLSELPAEAQRWELETSRAYLEELLAIVVDAFAYPYGGPNDFTDETVALLRGAGYRYACSTFDGCVRSRSDLYRLPRLDVKDWDGDELAARLRATLHGCGAR
jgi:peptidoglycan/xylan/chitin deacetylase (PgdA/CDA1 family)